MSRGGRFGWFLGLIFGATLGVLFAPRKGKELRDRMKDDRKKGNLGVSPLQDDLKHLGLQIAGIAKDLYNSDTVQDVVERGRKEVKNLSKDFVGEVSDFHDTRIKPIRKEVEEQVHFAHKTLNKASGEFKDLQGKVHQSSKIGKAAFKKIKIVMKKKRSK